MILEGIELNQFAQICLILAAKFGFDALLDHNNVNNNLQRSRNSMTFKRFNFFSKKRKKKRVFTVNQSSNSPRIYMKVV